jgi:hypothetical protein
VQFGHRDHSDRAIVISETADRDRSETTLGRQSAVELGLLLPDGPFWHDPVSIVQEAIADRVRHGRAREVVVPLGGRELAGDDG